EPDGPGGNRTGRGEPDGPGGTGRAGGNRTGRGNRAGKEGTPALGGAAGVRGNFLCFYSAETFPGSRGSRYGTNPTNITGGCGVGRVDNISYEPFPRIGRRRELTKTVFRKERAYIIYVFANVNPRVE